MTTALIFQGCLKVDPFIVINKNPNGTDLTTTNVLSKSVKDEISKFIKSDTRFDACMVMQGNKLIYSYVETNMPYNAASVMASIFSALFGIASDKGLINLDPTLGNT